MRPFGPETAPRHLQALLPPCLRSLLVQTLDYDLDLLEQRVPVVSDLGPEALRKLEAPGTVSIVGDLGDPVFVQEPGHFVPEEGFQCLLVSKGKAMARPLGPPSHVLQALAYRPEPGSLVHVPILVGTPEELPQGDPQ